MVDDFIRKSLEKVEVLLEKGVLPQDFVETARNMARFRNVLVHEYIDLDLQLIYETLQRLDDIRKFATYVVAPLKKGNQPSEGSTIMTVQETSSSAR